MFAAFRAFSLDLHFSFLVCRRQIYVSTRLQQQIIEKYIIKVPEVLNKAEY